MALGKMLGCRFPQKTPVNSDKVTKKKSRKYNARDILSLSLAFV